MHPILLLLMLTNLANAAKILGYFPMPCISHQLVFQSIWRELALRGHDLTIITADPLHDPSIKNLKEIDLHDVTYSVWNKYNISTLGTTEDIDSSDLTPFINVGCEIMDVQFEHPEVQEIITNKNNDKYDLFIVEFVTSFPFPLKDIYKCPMIGITSMPLMMHEHDAVGNPTHPILTPDINLPFARILNFVERLLSFVYWIKSRIGMLEINHLLRDTMKKYYEELDPDISVYGRKVSLVFANMNPALHPPRPNVPGIIDISGVHIKPIKPLPDELKRFMDSSQQGVIYVSFGSTIKSSLLPPPKIRIMLETFADLPYNIIWKYESDLPNKPSNVLIMKWVPQQDVLRHPNLKLFIMQGGLQSWEEAIYGKVPILVIPFYGDQLGNAKKAEDLRMGKSIKFSELNKINFKATILEIINDKRYKARLEDLYSIAVDQPMTGLEKAIWWTEYVLRHNGAEHLKSAAVEMPYYQYFLLDVLLFLATALLVCLFVIVKSTKFIFRITKTMYLKVMCKKVKSS